MRNLLLGTLFLFLFFCNTNAFAQVTLPHLVSDGMVLQRDSDVRIWGWASENEEIMIEFNGDMHQTTAGESGEWEIQLGKLDAGGPYSMTIEGKNRLTIDDIYVGDVWVASGQSNMELPMERVRPLYEDVIEQA